MRWTIRLDGVVNQYGRSHWKSVSKSCSCLQESVYQNILIANREEDFMDNPPGSMFQKILNWRYQFILPVEDVDFLPGTDSSLFDLCPFIVYKHRFSKISNENITFGKGN
jgi:hypothetical protein